MPAMAVAVEGVSNVYMFLCLKAVMPAKDN